MAETTVNANVQIQEDYSLTMFNIVVRKAAQLKPEQRRDVAMLIRGYLVREEAG